VYRVSDAALLLAAIVMHHLKGEGDFNKLLGGPWPEGHSEATLSGAVVVGCLILFAAMGKSALVPFSGWLPRAMEGPTPSSAIFYGALSVHLGAYLLLRFSPLLETSVWLSGAVVAIGLLTAIYAYIIGSVQSDIKSALSFASLVQVGLIVAEIGLGFRYIALVHLLGNACLRTLQFLRAPTLLHDYHLLENAIGDHLPHESGSLAPRVYRFALERGYLDAFLTEYFVHPLLRFFRWADRLERQWTDFLTGSASREDHAMSSPDTNSLGDLS
jgi:NAD(P)H-quinone oxidoreductase subunit 5